MTFPLDDNNEEHESKQQKDIVKHIKKFQFQTQGILNTTWIDLLSTKMMQKKYYQ